MTRDEFLSLPPTVALRVLLDAAPKLVESLSAISMPPLPRRPRYDFAIYRKDGVQWASETDLSGLQWWRDRYQQSAEGGGQYAEKDAKRVASLDRWIAWRQAEPAERWVGERGDVDTTAAPPCAKPRVYSRDAQRQPEPEPEQGQEASDDIPF